MYSETSTSAIKAIITSWPERLLLNRPCKSSFSNRRHRTNRNQRSQELWGTTAQEHQANRSIWYRCRLPFDWQWLWPGLVLHGSFQKEVLERNSDDRRWIRSSLRRLHRKLLLALQKLISGRTSRGYLSPSPKRGYKGRYSPSRRLRPLWIDVLDRFPIGSLPCLCGWLPGRSVGQGQLETRPRGRGDDQNCREELCGASGRGNAHWWSGYR